MVGTAKSAASRKMLTQDSSSNSLSWYTNIPSPSNIADAPSRLEGGSWTALEYTGLNVVLDYMRHTILRVV